MDEKQFQRIGFAALKVVVKGLSEAVRVRCNYYCLQIRYAWRSIERYSPSIVGMATVLAMDTMKNAFKVAAGKMTRSDLAQEMVKELMISSVALAGGTVVQSFIGIPVVGFMIGSFIGSAIGSFAYNFVVIAQL